MSKHDKNGKNGKHDKSAAPARATVVSASVQPRGSAPAKPSPPPAAARAAVPASPSDTTPRTLQQQRAAFALKSVQAWTDKPADVRKKLNSYAAKMPFMVHVNGLGQTAAFYRAKGEKDPHFDLYRLLGTWLTLPHQPFAGKSDLLAGITATDLHTYVAAQAEAMQVLSWVKQFAAAFLESE